MLPEPEILETPRTGIGLVHRLLALCADAPPAAPGWKLNQHQARAQAEPRLNAWAAQVLGDPAQVRCRVAYLDAQTGAALGLPLAELRLAELRLSPLDIVYLAPAAQGRPGELEQRLSFHLRRNRPAGVPADADVRLDLTRDPSWPPQSLSLAEFLEFARAVRQLLTSARPLKAADLALPRGRARARRGAYRAYGPRRCRYQRA